MATVLPLHLRIVRDEWADRVPTPAHDSLTPAERRQFLVDHPDSYLAVTRGPEDVLAGLTRDELLAQGRAALDRLIDTGAFSALRPPSFYVYELVTADHSQIGIVGGVATSDYADGNVKLHENVQPERADHLGHHFGIVGVQSSPIALAHRPLPEISELLRSISHGQEPMLDFASVDGLRQRIWPVDDAEASQRIIDVLATTDLYLIDGHHRTAAALAHREMSGPGRADRVLSAIFSSDELRNRSHHRMLRLGDRTDAFLSMVHDRLPVRTTDDLDVVANRRIDELALRGGGTWHLVTVPFIGSPDVISDRLDNLDPVRLKRGVLEPLIGIDSMGYDSALSYRPGTTSDAELAAEADAEGLIFAMMRPIEIDDLLAASDAGLIMPAKSTYFEPKARSGVFVRPTTN